jgi:hypothetical protein
LPQAMLVRGKGPRFEVLSETAVRYSWDEPNPQFLSALAGPSPLYLYRPAHYLKKFHPKYIGLEKANAQASARARAAGPVSTRRRTSSIASTIPICLRSSRGSTRRRCPPRASCSCATPIFIASTNRAGSFPTSTA